MRTALLLTGLFISCACFSQKTDTLIKKLDSLETDKTKDQKNTTNRSAYNEQTKITFKNYFILLGSDLKQEFTAPFHFTKKDWLKFGALAVTEAALTTTDEPIQRWALRLRTDNKAVRGISKYVTRFGGLYEGYVLVTFGAYGFIFKNEKMKTTTLLATQSYITGGIMEAVLKTLTGRQRPTVYTGPNGEAEPTFKGPFSPSGRDVNGRKTNSSFPSGHTTVAFAAATVFAMEYRDRLWVPILSYSTASLIGLSRITENRHWLTDVIAGAALGFFTGRHVVDNYHRYAKLKDPKRNKLTFDLEYNYNHMEPALVYRFR
jgi:membrane-associated phospholipid phosphatase